MLPAVNCFHSLAIPAEEKKLIEAGFDYVRYSDKDEVAIYRKRK